MPLPIRLGSKGQTHMTFPSTITIGDRKIGPGHPVLIIAEAGVAHFGDMGLARELVALAAEGGADVFKTQIFDVEQMISIQAAAWRERLRPRNLTLDQALELAELAESRGLMFMATAHDESRLDWLSELRVPAVKIGSGERGNTPFLQRLAGLGLPVILSTGMFDINDVHEAIAALKAGGCEALALLHCVTSYPTPDSDVNLRAMAALQAEFPGPVGYSDHTVDFLACYGAIAMGASILEKHITILRDIPNAQDWKVSAGPDNFPDLVRAVRRLEAMRGSGVKEAAPSERVGMNWALKSLVASRHLPAGHVIAPGDLIAKRPAGGIAPKELYGLIGRVLLSPVAMDTQISESDMRP